MTFRRHAKTVLIPLFCFSFSSLAAAATCLRKRAAIDIGSAATKLKVVEVDVCQKKILSEVYSTEERVDYKDDFRRSSNKSFSDAIQKQGIAALKKLKAVAAEQGATEFSAVATGAYRDFQRSDSVLAQKLLTNIVQDVALPTAIITQEEEARIGFLSAVHASQWPADKLLVWDIGGATSQISFGQNKNINFAGIKWGATSLSAHIIAKVQKKLLKDAKTPNPISHGTGHFLRDALHVS